MEKEPEKEIMIDPKWSILEDGLGYQVLVVGGMPHKDRDGRDCIVFTIKADDKVRKRYNWRGGQEVDELGNTKITIAKIDLIPLNLYDDANKKWIYVKSFMHEETDLSNREKVLKLEMERLRRENAQLDAENIRVNEINELIRTNPGKYISMGSEVFQKAIEGLKELNVGKEKQ